MRAACPGAFGGTALGLALALGATAGTGCDAGATKLLGTAYCAMPVTTPPADLGVDAFYTQYLNGDGIPVLSSSAVDARAVVSACKIVFHMLRARPDVRDAMVRQHQSVAVIGVDEVTTDIPEYGNLYQIFPGQDWDRLRGVGATIMIPVSSVGEENMLCLPDDPFAGERLLVQTFATAVKLGVEAVDSTFKSRIRAAFDAATSAGLWRNTYAGANDIEYYAEGVQSWFNANLDVSPPDGTNGPINTRGELKVYDPALASLIEETMPDDDWQPPCP
jgi:hypothetical protein